MQGIHRMRHSSFIYSLFYIFLINFIIGCGPIYNTEYVFSPPESATGRTCTFHCETMRGQCLQLEQVKAQQCESYSQREQDYCEYNIRVSKDREPKWYECVPESCNVDSERCEQSYRSCYQSCGGRVETVTRCVANCQPAPGTAQPAR